MNFLNFANCILSKGYPVYLHELLEDSVLYLPKVEPPPRVSENKEGLYLYSV